MNVCGSLLDVRRFLFRVVPRRHRRHDCCDDDREQRQAGAGAHAEICTDHVASLLSEGLTGPFCRTDVSGRRALRSRKEARTRSEVRREAERAAEMYSELEAA